MSKQLIELLAKEKIITKNQLSEALEASKNGKDSVRFLLERQYVAENKLLYFLSAKFAIPTINLSKIEIPQEVIRLIPPEVVRKTSAIPIQINKETVVVAICDPTLLASLENLKFLLKANIEAVLTSFSAYDAALQKYFGGNLNVAAAIETFRKETQEAEKNEKGQPNKQLFEASQIHEIDQNAADGDTGPVIQLVNVILTEGVRRGASDIHVEPYEKRFRVRMRIDGVLFESNQIPVEMKRAVISRFKIMSRMDISESRIPQDGRIKIRVGGEEIDFRVNSLPTLFGEKIVLRIIQKNNLKLDLLKLGFDPVQLDTFKKGIHSPNGLILVTGPTGSGKTTTLYSALAELNQTSDNLSTAEDPVEYNLEGINQVQVHKEIGLTFPAVLRSLLRQDPDVILVGEIRDTETAEVSVQAALTGHLVLSTLHTNDAPSAITRLINMGVEPFLVVAAVNTIIAQRLIRKICDFCKMEQPNTVSQLHDPNLKSLDLKNFKMFIGRGCPRCEQSGYKGRVAIYEIFRFSDPLKEMVLKGETMANLRKQAISEGMSSLKMSALKKVSEGLTSLEEALSVSAAE